MKIRDFIVIAVLVFLMSGLSQVLVKEYIGIDTRIIRDTITVTINTRDTIETIKYIPANTIKVDTVIHKEWVVIPSEKDTLYINVPGVILPGTENEVNVYKDSLINEDIALYYRHVTHGRLIDFRFDKISYYPQVTERTVIRNPFFEIEGLAGVQFANGTYPTVGIKANVANIGAGFLANGLGSTYFMSYKKSF